MNTNPPFKVLCVNDRNKPAEIPMEKWVKDREIYTVIKVGHTLDGKIGFILKEITLTEKEYPFELFSAHRFIPYTPSEEEFEDEGAENFVESIKTLITHD